MAKVEFTPEALHQFHALPQVIRARMEKVIGRLRRWPAVSGAKPLGGNLTGCYRVRTGDYRLQFRVRGPTGATLIIIDKVGHRDGFYEE